MTIDQFRSTLLSRPFQPFTLHLADGRRINVPHPEFAAMFPTGRTVIVTQRDQTYELIDLLLVVGLEVRPAAGSAT